MNEEALSTCATVSVSGMTMHIGVPLETHSGETRVAATPETVKKLIGQGHRVTLQSGAGLLSACRTAPMKRSARPSAMRPRHLPPSWC